MTDLGLMPRVTRRATLGGLSAALALGNGSASFGATSADARLVVINIRGALDGLATVIPYADPALAGLRSGLVPAGMLKVGNFFALHPSLANFHAMMQAGQAMAIHAVGPTVAQRSHFAGQDYLQSGAGQLLSSGWLNRALGLLGNGSTGLSVASQVPLLMRGATVVDGYAPDPYQQMPTALAARLPSLAAADGLIGPADAMAIANRALYNQILHTSNNLSSTNLPQLAGLAGKLLAAGSGPRIVTLETQSVDTHDAQNTRLPSLLADIDGAFAALQTSLGSAWANTVVLTMTEFGRTAYENGTQGTDHGTAFAVLLAGGAVAGGNVLTTWPGLAANQLYQGRDLAPTTDFRSIAMGILNSHMGLPLTAQASIFPGSTGIVPMTRLTSGG